MNERMAVGILFVSSILIQLPFFDQGASVLDEGTVLLVASELAHGDVLYRDQTTFVAPLTVEILAALFRMVGESMAVGRGLQASLFVAMVLLAYGITRSVLSVPRAFGCGLALLALKPLGFPMYTIVNYSQLGMVFLLVALFCALRFGEGDRIRWLVLSGLGVGLACITKQNLGAIAACVSWIGAFAGGPIRPAGRWVRGSLVMGAAAAAPVVAAAACYAYAGILPIVVKLVIGRALEPDPAWLIPLPPLTPWAAEANAGALYYAYLPSLFVDLQLQGLLGRTGLLSALLELLVKTAYLVPVAAILALMVRLVRRLASPTPERAVLASVLAGAALSFASMLYRADFAHLANVYPVLILATAQAVAPWRRLGRGLLVLWLAFAVSALFAFGASRRETVATKKGEVSATEGQAHQLRRLMVFADSLEPDQSVAFLPAQPLHQFLSGRRLDLKTDLIVPWGVGGEEDESLARGLEEVDVVVYDPHPVPWVGGSLHEFAPRFASVLAHEFAAIGIVTPRAIVLHRRAHTRSRDVSADLWSEGDFLEQEAWLGYRVIVPRISGQSRRDCFQLPLHPQSDEELSVLPLFDPTTWAKDYRGIWIREPEPVHFSIEILAGGEGPAPVFDETRVSGLPGDEVSIPLCRWSGRTVEARFCVEIDAGGTGFAPVGWAEPAILRRPGVCAKIDVGP